MYCVAPEGDPPTGDLHPINSHPCRAYTSGWSPTLAKLARLTWSVRLKGDVCMARSMTPAEKQRFRGYFPSLNVDAAVVTGETSQVYNCISWTVDVTDRWLWPGSAVANFDTFYRGFGFVRSSDGPIAAWGHSTSNMTHGSISGPGHGPRWESKCGSDLRIQHGLNELVGSTYGRVLAFYARSLALAAPATKVLEAEMKNMKRGITA